MVIVLGKSKNLVPMGCSIPMSGDPSGGRGVAWYPFPSGNVEREVRRGRAEQGGRAHRGNRVLVPVQDERRTEYKYHHVLTLDLCFLCSQHGELRAPTPPP